MNQGLLLIFVSFSGGGKSSIVRALRKGHPDWRFSVSYTTRKPRPGETDAEHYHFIRRETFEGLIAKDAFVEKEEVHGDLYGTPKEPLEKAIAEKAIFLLDIDVKGALCIMKKYPEHCLSFFIDVPDLKTLEKRLRLRGSEKEEDIQKRLSRIPLERQEKEKFDYVIINDKLDDAINEIEAIVLKKMKEIR